MPPTPVSEWSPARRSRWTQCTACSATTSGSSEHERPNWRWRLAGPGCGSYRRAPRSSRHGWEPCLAIRCKDRAPTDVVHHHFLHFLDLAANVRDRIGRGVVVEELLELTPFSIRNHSLLHHFRKLLVHVQLNSRLYRSSVHLFKPGLDVIKVGERDSTLEILICHAHVDHFIVDDVVKHISAPHPNKNTQTCRMKRTFLNLSVLRGLATHDRS